MVGTYRTAWLLSAGLMAFLSFSFLPGCGGEKKGGAEFRLRTDTKTEAKSAGGAHRARNADIVMGTAIAIESMPQSENYDPRADNPYHLAAQTPLSTFSIDVDTASYSNTRRFLMQENRLPPKDAVRVEEMINYFHYDDPSPSNGKPVDVRTEVATCPWQPQHKLVRIGLRAMSVPLEQQPPRNLVFLVDTSGSMTSPDRLPLLKQGLSLLIQTLRPEDRVAIVAYAGSAGLVLPSTPGTQKQVIESSLHRLAAGGSTNGGEGLKLAYDVAVKSFIQGGTNRVIIGTDGDFNVGVSSQGDLVRLIEEKRKTGVFLSVLGFGRGNLKDSTMEKLAHYGNGHFAYIDSLEEARRVFVEHGAALQVVATDVKIQVEFNPMNVQAYRLVGYENRLMRDQDFNDDTKDAGDIGSGHTVTALYEIVPPGVEISVPKVDKLRYQKEVQVKVPADTKELMHVKIRYKDPGAEVSQLITHPVIDSKGKSDAASVDFRFAAAVAEFAMVLRDSPHKGEGTFGNALQRARAAVGPDLQGDRTAFLPMIEAAQKLAAAAGN